MRIVFVVQRYGARIAGGAEQHCRWLAESLSRAGHTVTVATTCATDYVTWANHFSPGVSSLNGVTVFRFPVRQCRDKDHFDALSRHIDFFGGTHTDETENEWLAAQGPAVDDMYTWLVNNRDAFDVALVFTYLYETAAIAIAALKGFVPIAMHATAHDEPPIRLRTIKARLNQVDCFLCSTPEEALILEEIAGVWSPRHVVGIGVSLPPADNPTTVLSRYRIPFRRFALILGRVDESKGVLQAIEHFEAIPEPNRLHLVVAGENVAGIASNQNVTVTGYISDSERSSLLNIASFLIQPSPYESFSLALHEAWLSGCPTLSFSGCTPVAAQTHRANAGLLFYDQTSFADAFAQLSRDASLRSQLGRNGSDFVKTKFLPETVVRKIESILLSLTS